MDHSREDEDDEPSKKLMWVGVFVAAALLGLAWWHGPILILGFGSIVLAVALHGISHWVGEKLGMGHRVAVGLTLTIGLAAVVLGGVWLGKSGAEQYREVMKQLPAAEEDVADYFRSQSWSAGLVDSVPSPSKLARKALDNSSTSMMGLINGTAAALTAPLIAAVLAIYLVWQKDLYVRGTVRLFPPSRRERAREIMARIGRRLRSWLVGRSLSMLAVGLLTFVAMKLLGIPMALALGLLAAVLAFVPYIGPIASVIPALLLGFTQSPQTALYVGLAYLAVQQIEGNLITPVIQQREAAVPPVLLLIGQALAGSLFGLPGIIFSTPALVVAMVLIESVYLEGMLGETYEDVGDTKPSRSATRPQPLPACEAAPSRGVACAS